jgi:hypothetical protein
MNAGREAVTAAANRRLTTLADSLRDRTLQLESGREEPEEGEEEEEEEEEYAHDEGEDLRSTVEARFWARDRENMQVGRCERVAEVQIA